MQPYDSWRAGLVALFIALGGCAQGGGDDAFGGSDGSSDGGSDGGSDSAGGSESGCLDADGDGVTDCDGDCDDNDSAVHQGATEICGDGIDNDCNSATPDLEDADGDGVSCDLDCADDDAAVNPGALEICDDGVDNDCDAATPDLFDADMDGATCDVDCDETDDQISPLLPEVCDDGIDNDCDALTPDIFDGDSDGSLCTVDCDDDEAAAYPGNFEVCFDNIDNDCDALTTDQCGFFEDFEDGDFVGWANEGGSYTRTVDNIGANGTSRSLRQTGGTGSSHYNGLSMSFANLTPIGISLYVRSGSTTTSDGYMVFGHTPAGTTTSAAWCYMKGDGLITCFDGAVVTASAGAYSANTWYHLYFQMDWANQEFDLFVDNTLVLNNVSFRGNATTLQTLHLYNYTPGSTAWWDEITVF